MYLNADDENLVRKFALAGRSAAIETAVTLVICVKGLTKLRRDYPAHSIATSFYSAQELNDLVGAFRSLGCYVQHFADEVDFIRWASEGGIQALSHPNKVVYVASVNGVGPGKRCLVPSFCGLEGIRTLNSDAYSSAINRNKFHWTRLLESFGFRVPKSWLFEVDKGWLMNLSPARGQQVIAKTLFEDSSIGLSSAGVGEWSQQVAAHVREMSHDFKQPIMVQEFISGTEVEVPVLELGSNRVAFPVCLLKSDGTDMRNEFLSYDLVWDDQYRFTSASRLPLTIRDRLQATAIKVCEFLNFRYLSRVDFRIDSGGTEYVIDISTTPHLTRHSSYDYLFAGLGLEYSDVMATLLGAGISADGQSSSQY